MDKPTMEVVAVQPCLSPSKHTTPAHHPSPKLGGPDQGQRPEQQDSEPLGQCPCTNVNTESQTQRGSNSLTRQKNPIFTFLNGLRPAKKIVYTEKAADKWRFVSETGYAVDPGSPECGLGSY